MFEAQSTPGLAAGVRILDLDDSLTRQHEFLAPGTTVVNLKKLAPRLRFLSTRSALRDFANALQPAQKNHLTFYGSGDFHHLSAALIGQWRTPISVLVFDNHPDWDISSPWPCCGSWINEVLNFPHVKKVVVIGLGRYDLKGFHLLRGNVAALGNGKLELYPASWRRSKRMMAPDVRWKTLAREGLGRVVNRVLEQLPTRDIYLSIDKDCLHGQSAVTNWEKGELTLPQLTGAIAQIKRAANIVGADITGEYSRGHNANPVFERLSKFNHPCQPSFSLRALQTNQNTNIALRQALAKTA